MEIRLVDSVTGEVYEISVVDGELTMTLIKTASSGVSKYVFVDEETGEAYTLSVASGKLTMASYEGTGHSKLIDYLPSFVAAYREIKAIMDAEQFSVDSAWMNAENTLSNQFIQDATEEGVARYEKFLGITPKATYTLEERKFNILATMNFQLPYTMESLKTALTNIVGEDGYTLILDPDNYQLVVKLALGSENNVETVKELLDKMIPANIVTDVSIFNQYLILTGYTHTQLAAYTHKGLREEILS